MLVFFDIHNDLGCPLVPKGIEIPSQMGYLIQSSEATVVPHVSMNIPIRNLRRILLTGPPNY